MVIELVISGLHANQVRVIDAPGALHHIIARGIERKGIFTDGVDRDNFLNRLGNILTETQTACFSWTLLPNHLLLRTGTTSISFVMRRLLICR